MGCILLFIHQTVRYNNSRKSPVSYPERVTPLSKYYKRITFAESWLSKLSSNENEALDQAGCNHKLSYNNVNNSNINVKNKSDDNNNSNNNDSNG